MHSLFATYYATVPEARRKRLAQIETFISKEAPDAVGSLTYKMPTFKSNSGWIAFADQKHYIAIYTCSEEKIASYIRKHPHINHGKGCLRFSDSTQIDFDVLREVIRASLFSGKTAYE